MAYPVQKISTLRANIEVSRGLKRLWGLLPCIYMGLIIEGLPFNQVWHSPAFSMCNFTSVVPRKNYISHQGWRKVRSNNVTRPGPTWVTKKDPYLKLIQITRPIVVPSFNNHSNLEYRDSPVVGGHVLIQLRIIWSPGPLSYKCERSFSLRVLGRLTLAGYKNRKINAQT